MITSIKHQSLEAKSKINGKKKKQKEKKNKRDK
jgi:hypothetical protein